MGTKCCRTNVEISKEGEMPVIENSISMDEEMETALNELEDTKVQVVKEACPLSPGSVLAGKGGTTSQSRPVIVEVSNPFFGGCIQQCPEAVSYTHLTLPTILLVQISVVAVSLKKKKHSCRRNSCRIDTRCQRYSTAQF
eukprot:TRINITY_DN31817_c0_g1_i1.p2 TRINITY_DN31817_c0_g1~~TRINITY_DN31817_c0_g1_i1.p2  ORF type:complete len:140 (+),score=24.77 TRINITY_DN31817_c0_g1_i1:232-651(+)